MLTLGIETSSATGSVALVADGQLVGERINTVPNRHAEVLVGLVDELFSESDVDRDQIDRVAVGVGPGSFTGLRVGIALATGIATALRRPLIGICSLRSVAFGFAQTLDGSSGPRLMVVRDARREEIFFACYDGKANVLRPPHVVSRARFAEHIATHRQDSPIYLLTSETEVQPPSRGWPFDFIQSAADAPRARSTALLSERMPTSAEPVLPNYIRGADATRPQLRDNPLLSPRTPA